MGPFIRLPRLQEFSTIREPYVTEVTRAGLLYAAIGEIRHGTHQEGCGTCRFATRLPSWGTHCCQSVPLLDGINSREGMARRLSKGA